MEGEATVLLEDRNVERIERVDLVGNLGAAVSLLASASAGLPARDTRGTVLGVVEIVAGGMLLLTVARELRASRRRSADRADDAAPSTGWVNVFAAATLFAETYQRVYQGGKFSWATFLLGIVTLGLGVFQPAIQRRRQERRFVRADAGGIEFRSSRLRGFRVPWAELASVETGPAAATLTLHGGRRQRINLRRYHNGAEVARLLRESAAARGIPVSGEGAPTVAASLPPH